MLFGDIGCSGLPYRRNILLLDSSTQGNRMRYWIAVLLAIATGCRLLVWQPLAHARSPQGNTDVTVLKRCAGPDCIIRVSSKHGPTEAILFNEGMDRLPTAALVAWSDDSAVVGIVVCDKVAGNLMAGFEPDRGARIPWEAAKPVVSAWVQRHYRPRGDPIDWVCSVEGLNRVGKEVPDTSSR
jgi:hypothetical protein